MSCFTKFREELVLIMLQFAPGRHNLDTHRSSVKVKEVLKPFDSIEAWRKWLASHPEVLDPIYIESLVKRGLERGLYIPFIGNFCVFYASLFVFCIFSDRIDC